jgi:hypothetical protein
VQTSKTAPKGAAIFIADCLARDSYLLTNNHGLDTTAELLGLGDGQAVAKLVADLGANGDGRARVITLALVVGALESRTPKDAWRNATPSWSHHVGPADYLGWLRDHADYPLSAVEEIITGTKDSEEVLQPVFGRRDQAVTPVGGVRASALAPPLLVVASLRSRRHVAFWRFDHAVWAVALKAPASALLRAVGLVNLSPGPSLPLTGNNSRPDLALHGLMPAYISIASRQQNGRKHSLNETTT